MQVPRTYISKIENGKAIPTLGSLERLATALGVEMRQLVRDERSRRDEEVASILSDSIPGRGGRTVAASGLAAPDVVLRRREGRSDGPAPHRVEPAAETPNAQASFAGAFAPGRQSTRLPRNSPRGLILRGGQECCRGAPARQPGAALQNSPKCITVDGVTPGTG